MTLSKKDRRALERIEQELVHDAPELTAMFAPDLRSRLALPWQRGTALGCAVGVQLLAAVVCMYTDSLLLVLAMLALVVASVVPLARARD
ncbi:DUF3040 domain-containing protein [Nocardioides pacificus]